METKINYDYQECELNNFQNPIQHTKAWIKAVKALLYTDIPQTAAKAILEQAQHPENRAPFSYALEFEIRNLEPQNLSLVYSALKNASSSKYYGDLLLSCFENTDNHYFEIKIKDYINALPALPHDLENRFVIALINKGFKSLNFRKTAQTRVKAAKNQKTNFYPTIQYLRQIGQQDILYCLDIIKSILANRRRDNLVDVLKFLNFAQTFPEQNNSCKIILQKLVFNHIVLADWRLEEVEEIVKFISAPQYASQYQLIILQGLLKCLGNNQQSCTALLPACEMFIKVTASDKKYKPALNILEQLKINQLSAPALIPVVGNILKKVLYDKPLKIKISYLKFAEKFAAFAGASFKQEQIAEILDLALMVYKHPTLGQYSDKIIASLRQNCSHTIEFVTFANAHPEFAESIFQDFARHGEKIDKSILSELAAGYIKNRGSFCEKYYLNAFEQLLISNRLDIDVLIHFKKSLVLKCHLRPSSTQSLVLQNALKDALQLIA